MATVDVSHGVALGTELPRWLTLKENRGFPLHQEVARFLLDFYDAHLQIQGCPLEGMLSQPPQTFLVQIGPDGQNLHSNPLAMVPPQETLAQQMGQVQLANSHQFIQTPVSSMLTGMPQTCLDTSHTMALDKPGLGDMATQYSVHAAVPPASQPGQLPPNNGGLMMPTPDTPTSVPLGMSMPMGTSVAMGTSMPLTSVALLSDPLGHPSLNDSVQEINYKPPKKPRRKRPSSDKRGKTMAKTDALAAEVEQSEHEQAMAAMKDVSAEDNTDILSQSYREVTGVNDSGLKVFLNVVVDGSDNPFNIPDPRNNQPQGDDSDLLTNDNVHILTLEQMAGLEKLHSAQVTDGGLLAAENPCLDIKPLTNLSEPEPGLDEENIDSKEDAEQSDEVHEEQKIVYYENTSGDEIDDVKEKDMPEICQMVCSDCLHVFASRKKFMTHREKRQHLGQHWYSCAACFYSYPNMISFRTHIAEHHMEGLPKPEQKKRDTRKLCISCPKCSWIGPSSNHLRTHLMEHLNQNFLCDKCPYTTRDYKAFSDHKYLVHVRKNIPKRKIMCEICGKQYEPGILNRHIRTVHEKQLLFQCALCDKRCTNKSSLLIHQEVHSNIRNIICPAPECKMTFKHKRHLGPHIRRKHKHLFAADPQYQQYVEQHEQQQNFTKIHNMANIQNMMLDMDSGPSGVIKTPIEIKNVASLQPVENIQHVNIVDGMPHIIPLHPMQQLLDVHHVPEMT